MISIQTHLACDLDERPNDQYILSMCGLACKNNWTPNQVVDMMMIAFCGHTDRDWVMQQVLKIQINFFNNGFIVGMGRDFPFEFKTR